MKSYCPECYSHSLEALLYAMQTRFDKAKMRLQFKLDQKINTEFERKIKNNCVVELVCGFPKF